MVGAHHPKVLDGSLDAALMNDVDGGGDTCRAPGLATRWHYRLLLAKGANPCRAGHTDHRQTKPKHGVQVMINASIDLTERK